MTNTPLIIENQYLFVAHEAGWLGLILFLMIFIGVMNRLWQLRTNWLALGVFASGLGLAIIGLLLPVWVDDTVAIVWWGLAAFIIGGGEYERHQIN
jgi:cyanate permease